MIEKFSDFVSNLVITQWQNYPITQFLYQPHLFGFDCRDPNSLHSPLS